MTRGRFIVFEGLDGSGKTTQAKLLADALTREGRRVHLTAEPTSGPVGAVLRNYLSHRLRMAHGVLPYLFAADRADHLYQAETGVLALLEAGTSVICDRYVLSSLAYQSTEAAQELVEHLNRDFPPPDLTIYLEVSPDQGMEAAKRRQTTNLEINDTLEKQRAVAREYNRVLVSHGARQKVVKVSPKETPEKTATEILGLVLPLFSAG